ncbi:MAG: polysaccharide deacetylase family protein, partial [Clostridia bacterium]|nr:polysaccharide deacetylase family protein [Clostridia bacterium]
DDISSQLSRTDQLISELTGHAATVVRPPYGSYNDTVASIAARPLILWSVDTLDWETQNADSIVQNVMDGAADGQIILLHDIFKESVDAAEIFIPELIQEGYQLVTVSELAAAKGITLENGVSYGSF